MWVSITTTTTTYEKVCMHCEFSENVYKDVKLLNFVWIFNILKTDCFSSCVIWQAYSHIHFKKYRETCDAKCKWFKMGRKLTLNIHPQFSQLFLFCQCKNFHSQVSTKMSVRRVKRNLIVSTWLAPFQLRQDMQTVWRS